MKSPAGYIKQLFVDYFSLKGYLVSQQDAEATIREGVSFRGTNIVILILAILIASLGLNTNSTAVIIGAMLISPLMGPIIGLGLGVGIQDFELIKRCLRNLAMAAGFSVAASALYFLISPVSEGHSELLARTSPSIYDVLIGFFGGGAGIIAIGSRSKGNVIPGVAIATALMPPLCTAGYGLATWQLNYFGGAFYLFLINSIYIALATFIGVKLMHYRPVAAENPERAKKVRRIVYTVAILTLLPSVWLTYNMLRQNRFEMNASRFVNQEFKFQSTRVMGTRAYCDDGQRIIDVTLIGKFLPEDSLEMAMGAKLKFYGLQGVHLNIIQGDNPMGTTADNTSATVRDIYTMAQATISQKQQTIDSLRSVLAVENTTDTAAAMLRPELRALFPQVADLAVTRAVFAPTTGADRLDTANVALVKYNTPITAQEKERLRKYLEARLRMRQVEIIDVRSAKSK